MAVEGLDIDERTKHSGF
jgi:hypothetical protein